VDLAQEAAQQTDIKFFTPSQLHSRTKQELRIQGTPQLKRTMSSFLKIKNSTNFFLLNDRTLKTTFTHKNSSERENVNKKGDKNSSPVLLQHQTKNHFKLTVKEMTTHFTVRLKSKKRENNNRNKILLQEDGYRKRVLLEGSSYSDDDAHARAAFLEL
jgi:hypothetical protein